MRASRSRIATTRRGPRSRPDTRTRRRSRQRSTGTHSRAHRPRSSSWGSNASTSICARAAARGTSGRTRRSPSSRRATWPSQRVVRSTLEKVADAVTQQQGSRRRRPRSSARSTTLARHARLVRAPSRSSGKRVFVTRTRAQAGKLSALLRELGADALEFPAIRIDRAVELRRARRCARRRSTRFDVDRLQSDERRRGGLVATRSGRSTRGAFAGARIAAVGPATADALRATRASSPTSSRRRSRRSRSREALGRR